MPDSHYIAVDLGAESGRVMLGTLSARRKITLHEIHRFPSGVFLHHGTRRWNIVQLIQDILEGIRKAGEVGVPISGISCDSWGVDYVLLYKNEPFLTLPYHYRDPRCDGSLAKAAKVLPLADIFKQTGIQLMEFNTLFQLQAHLKENEEILRQSDFLLNIGDYFNFLFSGVAKSEISLASTTQLMAPGKPVWADKLIRRFGIPHHLFRPIVASATPLGPVLKELQTSKFLQKTKAVATCSHDTGAAVAAVPFDPLKAAYLSSGTWSLIGVELPEPIVTPASFKANFTNEAGADGTTRFLKNIAGLFVLQESRKDWTANDRAYSYAEIAALAEKAKPLTAFLNLEDSRFVKPGNMVAKVQKYCQQTHQPVPKTVGQIARVILESLALTYRAKMNILRELTGRKIEALHIVGGGCQNHLLNQFAANALHMPVYAGPVEATALGNILLQAKALRHIRSLKDLRKIVAQSYKVEKFLPKDVHAWEKAYHHFAKLKALQ